MNKELSRYLKLFTNYERRFKHLTILIPIELYNKFRSIIENQAETSGFIKYGEISDVAIFKNWR